MQIFLRLINIEERRYNVEMVLQTPEGGDGIFNRKAYGFDNETFIRLFTYDNR